MKHSPTNINSIDEYIGMFPGEVSAILSKLRETIRAAAPNAEEKISYQIPTFFLNRNLVHFAAFKRHIGFYPGASGIANFEKELSGYKTAKGSVQFPIEKPLPLSLIRKIVRFRVTEEKTRVSKKKTVKRK
ncbi:hypothetical protein EHQ12_15765 [Leptospira gomenensis]|uniref:YdhG-like domain-containing protein n=1 Tax=Leptospira gomenensis TaxID=2484974 RepID=A0A5F1YDE6_9LEPT|nr:DUF1801 domain-containing protein [Leptospira gomenensis]TGK35056.1 hypothetical protein EHQ12_15765 [Leptospira gomenensis]TGK35266.1 hypothetical protein EHQ17_07460 [Leptospira gomenensis]TGK51751.1 hypothetical protein EHQ07_01960 [Leptospira gomenensis]TGK58346.1 hypothetical protein EHQ13_13865 [Leptospira gomenensis]